MDERLKVYEEKMTKSYDSMIRDFTSIRAGRANPHVLDKIKVDYYGAPTPLQQVGNVSVPEPRMLQIQPWEKSLLKGIEKAILASDLGITPTNDGSVIRLVFPELTEERRKELVKDIKNANETFKKQNKANEISEDDQKDLETKVQKMTDKYIADIDKAVEEKSKEILTV